MSEFTIHTPETAPAAARDALRALEQNIGFIPNLAGTIAGSPVALQGFVAVQSALRQSALTGVEREVVGLTVSYANTSEYSMAAHSAFAAGNGASEDVLAALRAGDALPDPRLEALRTFANDVLAERGHVPAQRVNAFEQAGYTAEQALEVVTQIAYTTLANLVANIAGTPVDDAFAARAWAPAAA